MKAGVTEEYLQKQVNGLSRWIDVGEKGIVQQGWFVYRKCQKERTYIMIKPDGVQRGLIGKIIQRFE